MYNAQFDYLFMKSLINFHDTESIIPKHTRVKDENVQLWFDKYESFTFCSLFHLSDIQKFIFAERQLSGISSLLIKSNIHSFVELKNVLLIEFGTQN